jgi:glycosyltransferase involved in cell wall biosynthesis
MEDKNRIVWVISDINKSKQFEDLIDHLIFMKSSLAFILINMRDSEMARFLDQRQLTTKHIIIEKRLSYMTAVFKCIGYLLALKPSVIHCHLLKANLIGLLSGFITRIPKRIYTRHHSTFHHQHAPNGVRLDRLSNMLATDIIAISQVVKSVLVDREGVPLRKVKVIPHGFDLTKIEGLGKNTPLNNLSPTIGVVSRFIEWKGVQFIIPAFQQLLEQYPEAKLMIYGGNGPYAKTIERMIENLPNERFQIIEFEPDIYSAYRQMDIYVHVPVDNAVEAYGQTYVEAACIGLPCIVTKSGIANEYIEHEVNALVVPYQDSVAIFEAMIRYLEEPELAGRLAKNATKSVELNYGLKTQVSAFLKLYA